MAAKQVLTFVRQYQKRSRGEFNEAKFLDWRRCLDPKKELTWR